MRLTKTLVRVGLHPQGGVTGITQQHNKSKLSSVLEGGQFYGRKKIEEGKGNWEIKGEILNMLVRIRLMEATFDKVIDDNNYDYYS